MVSVRTRGVVVFLLLSFGVTWTYLFVAWGGLGLSVTNPLVQLPMGFAPALSAVVVRRWVTREGFGDAGLALRLRTAWRHYLLAWVGPPLFAVAAVGAAAVLGPWRPGLAPLRHLASGLPWWAPPLVLMAAVVPLTPVYWGEEFGWTSYLRPRLFSGRPLPSTLATGLIWAVWHYPLAFMGYIEFPDAATGLAVWTVSLLFQEVILAWLWTRGGGVWVPSLAHAGNNLVFSLLSGQMLTDGAALDDTAVTALMAVPVVITGCWIILTGRLTPAPAARRAGAGPVAGPRAGVRPRDAGTACPAPPPSPGTTRPRSRAGRDAAEQDRPERGSGRGEAAGDGTGPAPWPGPGRDGTRPPAR